MKELIIIILLLSFTVVSAKDNHSPYIQSGNCQQIANWYAKEWHMDTVILAATPNINAVASHMINRKMIAGKIYYFSFDEWKEDQYYGDYIFDSKEKAEAWYSVRMNAKNIKVSLYNKSELSNIKYD